MSWRVTRRSVGTLGVLAAIGIAACGGGGGDKTVAPDVTPASIVVSPSTSQTIASGGSVAFTAEVRNKAGSALSGNAVSWMSSDPSIATIDQSGKLTAAKVGTASITASSGSVTST